MEIEILQQKQNNLRFWDLYAFINKNLKELLFLRWNLNDKMIDFN